VEPQVGQKWKVRVFALSAMRVHVVDSPAKVICSRRNRAAVAHGDAHGLALDNEIELATAAGGARRMGSNLTGRRTL
jgi:hypothetical protein